MNLGGTALQTTDNGTIPLCTGDELVHDRRIDFIKIDVEGMEIEVLQGLEQTISTYRPNIFVEVDNTHFPTFQGWVQKHSYEVVDRYNRYGTMENFMLVPRPAPTR